MRPAKRSLTRHPASRLQRCALDDLDPGAPGIGDVGDDVAGRGAGTRRLVELDAVRLERLEKCRMLLHIEADVVEHAMPGRRLRGIGLGEADLAARHVDYRLLVTSADLAA